jgi:hypothetical protein
MAEVSIQELGINSSDHQYSFRDSCYSTDKQYPGVQDQYLREYDLIDIMSDDLYSKKGKMLISQTT